MKLFIFIKSRFSRFGGCINVERNVAFEHLMDAMELPQNVCNLLLDSGTVYLPMIY